MATAKKKEFLTFRGKPLVRSGNTIYFGNPADAFIAMIQIVTQSGEGEDALPDRVAVQIISTDETLHTSKRVIKHTEKPGLYPALEIASIWLERSLATGA